MASAADAAFEWSKGLPNSEYAIPESTPDASARGHGKQVDQGQIPQFGEGSIFKGEEL